MLTTGFMVCLDKLAIGVSLAFVDVSLTPLIGYLVVQSFIVTMLGLALGKRLGAQLGGVAKLVAGGIFVLLGAIIIYQTYTNHSYI